MKRSIAFLAMLCMCIMFYCFPANALDLPPYQLPATIDGHTFQEGAITIYENGSYAITYYNRNSIYSNPTYYSPYNRWDTWWSEKVTCTGNDFENDTSCTWNYMSALVPYDWQQYANLGQTGVNDIINVDGHIYSSMDILNTDSSLSYQGTIYKVANWSKWFPLFRYPIDYTPENHNGWHNRVQSFGSLNNGDDLDIPHAAEDWNMDTGGCTDIGEPLSAIANGTVVDITLGNGSDGWGKTILIQHDAPSGKYFLTGTGQMLSTVYSLYAHMLKSGQDASYDSGLDIQVGVNDPIVRGASVGQVGNGDGQWACHLHFAILTDADLVSTYRSQNPYSWGALDDFADPSELIRNGLYSDQSTSFTIVVHPYECSGTFQLSGNTPGCSSPSSTIGGWTRRGVGSGSYELGYSGIIYSKSADTTGTASWTPNLPKNGQYLVSVYIPNSATYVSSEEAEYVVTSNSVSSDPIPVNQSANHGEWVNLGTFDLYQGDTAVTLDGDTGETGKVIAVDAVKFEYLGPIQ